MMYFKPPQNNHNDFYHPLNQVNEEKFTKARVMFKGSPSDARRDMRVAKETGLYQSATEKPSGRGRVYEITFKSEGQFRRFMSQFEVDLMEYPLKESRDDFDYLDIEAAMQDAKLEAPKVVKTRKGYQVMVYSRKVKKFIPQGPPHRSKAAAEKDAKMFEDVQLDETNFRFPQSGEDYGELITKSISGTGPSMSDLKKQSAEIRRKFAAAMRKHKGTKVGEVLDLLDKMGERKVYQDNDIKLIKRYLTKFKDNVRKVAHQMMIDLMYGDDYLAKKRIPVKEDVQLDEVAGETRVMAKGDRNHFERITRALGHASANGKIDGYEGAHINEPKGIITLIFDTKAHKAKSQRQMVAKMLKTYGLKFDHSIEEGFASDAQRRAAFASGYKAKGKKKNEEEIEEADINMPDKPKNAIKKPKNDSRQTVGEGLRQAMSGPRETESQKRKRMEKDNFDLYKKRQNRVAALRGDKSSRQLTPKQQRDYLRRVNLDQIRAMEDIDMQNVTASQLRAIKEAKVYRTLNNLRKGEENGQ